MSGNGQYRAAQISQESWDRFRDKIHSLEEDRVNLGPLMAELSGTRKAAESAHATAVRCFNELGPMKASLEELQSWKEDSKVQRIHELKGQVSVLEQQRDAATKEAERDRLDVKRTIRASLISSVIAATVAWSAAKLTAPPAPAPVVAPAK